MRALLLALLVLAAAPAHAQWGNSWNNGNPGWFNFESWFDGPATTASCGAPPSTSLSVWLDSTDVDGNSSPDALNNGDPVTTWVSKGSVTDNPTQGGASTLKPTYTTNCIGSRPCLRFDGGDWLRATTASNFTFMHNGAGSTVYTVVKTSASAIGTIVATSTGSAASIGMGHRYNTSFRASYYNADGTTLNINLNSANNAVGTSLFDVMTTTLGNHVNPGTIYVNGTQVAASGTVAFSAAAPAGAMTIGATTAGGSNLTGDVLQVLVYAAEHDATQRAAVQTWLTCTYGSFPQ